MLDLITVVFQEELNLLRTQAESIHKYVSDDNVNSITVIVNDKDNVASLIDPAWWKSHQHKVTIKPYSNYNYISRINGWENQQLLKLLAAAESDRVWAMVLDAKTWFIQPLDIKQLFDYDGKPNVGRAGISPHFKSSQQFVERYYNVRMPDIIGPAGVPFIFHCATVRDMIDEIPGFIEWFQINVRYPNLITEFHLYSGYVMSKYSDYRHLYNNTRYYDAVNIADWEADNFDTIFSNLTSNDRVLTASIHRRTYSKLTETQCKEWANFLIEKQLIVLDLETINRLNTCKFY